VLTSSIATLYNDACDVSAAANHTVQESDVNLNKDSSRNTYAYSKTVAEQAAWEMHKRQERWELITIHPGAIFGPSLSRRVDATSVTMMTQFLKGSFRSGVPKLWLGLVDVREVAEAHVRAALLRHANGRYIVVAKSLSMLDIARQMCPLDFGIPDNLPRGEVPKALIWLIAPFLGMQRRYVVRNVNFPIYFDSERSIRELGIAYRPTVETLNDHCRQIATDRVLHA
jgi:nucleoside-diphosphate-sugar epimerase